MSHKIQFYSSKFVQKWIRANAKWVMWNWFQGSNKRWRYCPDCLFHFVLYFKALLKLKLLVSLVCYLTNWGYVPEIALCNMSGHWSPYLYFSFIFVWEYTWNVLSNKCDTFQINVKCFFLIWETLKETFQRLNNPTIIPKKSFISLPKMPSFWTNLYFP